MAIIRVRHAGKPPKDRDLGPAIGRRWYYDAMRRDIDVALAEPPRKIEVELRQP